MTENKNSLSAFDRIKIWHGCYLTDQKVGPLILTEHSFEGLLINRSAVCQFQTPQFDSLSISDTTREQSVNVSAIIKNSVNLKAEDLIFCQSKWLQFLTVCQLRTHQITIFCQIEC